MGKTKVKKILTRILMYAVELIVIVLSAFPIVWVVLSSFKTNSEILSGAFTLPSGIQVGIEAYLYLFQKYNFLLYFRNSLIVSLISTGISLVCFSMAAYVLAKFRFPGRSLLFVLFTITMLVPGHAKAQPIFSLIINMNLYDSLTGVTLVYLGSGIAMSIFILRSAFMAVPKDLDEAASIDGAGFFRTFIMIDLPLAKSGLSTAGILMFLGNWNEYFYAALLTSSEKNRTLPVALQFFNQSLSYDYTKMFAALTVVVVPAIIVYCFAQEQVQQSVAASGVKG
ncbi:MAG: carbohydrate ABC transporter permease [Lachnospiraceae bacterium]|nr:carbohydrate ABC transporter permease [Lachnospiraceae bacterium]